jgi:hypothetical protein
LVVVVVLVIVVVVVLVVVVVAAQAVSCRDLPPSPFMVGPPVFPPRCQAALTPLAGTSIGVVG